MKIKEYVLRIVINEEDDELLHVSERYDCDECEDKFKLEIKGELIDAPDDMQRSLRKLNVSDILGIT